MKIAIGIIAIGVSLIMFIQSFAVYGLSAAIEEETASQAGALGVAAAFLMFIGGAFSFGVPKAAMYLFAISAFFAFGGATTFPDLGIWGGLAAIFAFLSWVARPKSISSSVVSGDSFPQNENHKEKSGLQSDEIECPVCAEVIKSKAKKCRFCNAELT